MKNLILIALAFYIWHINRAPKIPQREIDYSWSGGAGGSGTTTATTTTTPPDSSVPMADNSYVDKNGNIITDTPPAPTGRGDGYFSQIPPRRLIY